MTPEILKAAQDAGDTLLERLQAALASIDEHEYVFGNWNQCTCGHIYRAATGEQAATDIAVYTSDDERFRELLEVVAVANGHDIDNDPDASAHSPATSVDRLTSVVSNLTAEIAHGDANADYRAAAIVLIKNAIDFETERNEKARLALLGQ